MVAPQCILYSAFKRKYLSENTVKPAGQTKQTKLMSLQRRTRVIYNLSTIINITKQVYLYQPIIELSIQKQVNIGIPKTIICLNLRLQPSFFSRAMFTSVLPSNFYCFVVFTFTAHSLAFLCILICTSHDYNIINALHHVILNL